MPAETPLLALFGLIRNVKDLAFSQLDLKAKSHAKTEKSEKVDLYSVKYVILQVYNKISLLWFNQVDLKAGQQKNSKQLEMT